MLIINRRITDRTDQHTLKSAGDKLLRRIITTACMVLLALSVPHEGMAKGKKKQAPAENNKYASIIVDAATGSVLSEKNASKPLHPASLTKVMTLLLLFDALENGNVRLSDRIYISDHAAAQQPSKLGLNPGSSIRVEDAILAVVTKSANDIAAAIGEHLAGSESRFAVRMTRRAHDIGMTKTNFANASGLHNSAQISTARDMAILARYIIVRYPNYYRYFSTKQFTYRGKTMTNHNRLMQTYRGMDGFKTGFINQSGFNLIASAKRDGQRLIGVVFGGRSWKSRNDHMASLLNTGFGKLGELRYAQGAPVPVDVANASIEHAPVTPPPIPTAKPVFKEIQGIEPQAGTATANFTSLSSLGQGRKLVVGQTTPEPDVTEQAVASVQSAINRGDYSELTGQGDYDAANARRVETGLIAAAVYKGDHDKVRELQLASAAHAANGTLQQPTQGPTPAPASMPPSMPATSDLWSIQIGAYTSRVTTDDALRYAHSKLPANLIHARPIVVPLKSNGGILFRARLGGLSQQQAIEACRYFRDCLPVEPR